MSDVCEKHFETNCLCSHIRYGLYAYVNDNIFHVRNLLNQIFRPSWLFETKSAGLWLCVNDGMDPDHPGKDLHVHLYNFFWTSARAEFELINERSR